MRRILATVAWSVILGSIGTMVWLVVTPFQESVLAGHLQEFVRHDGASSDALSRMWRLQLPGTVLSCSLFLLLVAGASRAVCPTWHVGEVAGAAIGGSLAMLFFGSPPPGIPFLVWTATFYATGIPTLLALEALEKALPFLRTPLVFSSLVALWPIVVTGTLTSLGALTGAIVGGIGEKSALQNNEMQLTQREVL